MKSVLIGLMLVVMLFGGVGVSYALDATLVWTNPVTTFGIQVEKAPSVTGTFAQINRTAVNAVTYNDTTNQSGDTSCYKIAYFNASGVGPYTSAVCKSFPIVPTQTPANFGVN